MTIKREGKPLEFNLNQRKSPNKGAFHSLGILELNGEISIELRNRGTNGHVIADAVCFLAIPKE